MRGERREERGLLPLSRFFKILVVSAFFLLPEAILLLLLLLLQVIIKFTFFSTE
jgi:hypothetical protein